MDRKMHPLEAFALCIDAAENYLKLMKANNISDGFTERLEEAIPEVDEIWRKTVAIAVQEQIASDGSPVIGRVNSNGRMN